MASKASVNTHNFKTGSIFEFTKIVKLFKYYNNFTLMSDLKKNGWKINVLTGCNILGLSTLIAQFLIDAITSSNVFLSGLCAL